MQSSRQVLGAGLALGVVLWFSSGASAGPKEEVATATLEWAHALGQDDPDRALPFYSEDAVLWGTLSPTVRADQAALRDYFVNAFKALPGLKVAFGDQLIRVYGASMAALRLIPVTTRFLTSRTERRRTDPHATASPT
jgi:hypothetical protein